MLHNIKAVLFDLDGTLLDTEELIISSFKYCFKNKLNRDIDVQDLYPFFGKPLKETFRTMTPEIADEMILAYRRHNLEMHDQMVKPFPLVREVLSELKKRGLKLGIVTSKVKATTVRGLELFDLTNYFDTIVAMEDTRIHKPNPQPVLKALENLDTAPQEAVMVGDSPYDIISAKRAGVKSIAVKWSSFTEKKLKAEKPDYMINNLMEIIDVLQLISSNEQKGVEHQ